VNPPVPVAGPDADYLGDGPDYGDAGLCESRG
jgi:hypothetical protein